MTPTAPHTHPLPRWHRIAIAMAVAVQGLAMARVSPWLHPAWAAVLALTLGASALPAIRSRGVLTALALTAQNPAMAWSLARGTARSTMERPAHRRMIALQCL